MCVRVCVPVCVCPCVCVNSVKSLVTKSAFWQRYGAQVVQVEADVFKVSDATRSPTHVCMRA